MSVGYQAGMPYRYVVTETMEDGTVCVLTLGWSRSTKGSLKELNARDDWSDARYQEIHDPSQEYDRPTRWLLDGSAPLPPEKQWRAPSAKDIVREQLKGTLEKAFVAQDYIVDRSHPLTDESCAIADDEPDFAAIEDDEPDFGTAEEMIETDDDEEDGWSI